VAGRPLRTDEELEAQIEGVSRMAAERMKRPYADFAQGVTKQATVPDGADVLGLAGTAPGLVVEASGTPVIVLPGPPPELQRLWPRALETDAVRRVLDRGKPPLRRTLRFFGPGESQVAQAFQEAGGDGDGLEVTICARSFEIHVDLVADPSAEGRLLELEAGLEQRLGKFLYSTDGRTVEEIVLDRCRARGWKLATAESCTGGLVAAGLTAIPGSSEVVVGGIVSYANEVKIAEGGLGRGRGSNGARSPRASRCRGGALGHGRRRPGRRHRGEARGTRLLPRRDAGGRPRLVVQLPGRPRLDPAALGRRRPTPRAANVGTEW
jgi:nicotinamide-nucleotide amidase